MRLARVVGIIGRVLVGAGILLLFYTAYLLWGTGVYTRNVQKHFTEQLARRPVAPVAVDAAGNAPPAIPQTKPKLGDPLFTLLIPKIGLRTVVVEGVGPEELKKGPGHFPEAGWPGEERNLAISGHRTTYGAPFFRVNELEPGDLIAVDSGAFRYRYVVSAPPQIVEPTRIDVVRDHGVAELTLTSCHPRFSASQRIIISARYEGAAPIAPPGAEAQEGPGEAQAETEGQLVKAPPPAIPAETLALAALALAALLGAGALQSQLRRLSAWTAAAVVVGAGLWVAVFPQVLRLMPPNY